MAKIIWTEPALTDLNAIAEYIAISNYSAAQELVAKVVDRVDVLAAHPLSGKIPEELSYLHYRELVVSPCRIYYKYEANSVYVLHILRQERDLQRFLISKGVR